MAGGMNGGCADLPSGHRNRSLKDVLFICHSILNTSFVLAGAASLGGSTLLFDILDVLRAAYVAFLMFV